MIKQRGVLKFQAPEINSYREFFNDLFGNLGSKYTNSSFNMKMSIDWFKTE